MIQETSGNTSVLTFNGGAEYRFLAYSRFIGLELDGFPCLAPLSHVHEPILTPAFSDGKETPVRGHRE